MLHRLFVSGSDRACGKWRADYRIEGTEALQLHHLYRAMAWLGEPLPGRSSRPHADAALPQGPRGRAAVCPSARPVRRTQPSSSWTPPALSFEGRGGDTLGRRGHSKDYRPDLNQMIVGLVMDQDGRPLCWELWPGNTADVTTLFPVVDRLRARFGIGRICVVADRGMISAETIAALEQRKLGIHPRRARAQHQEVRELVIDDQTPFVPLVVPRVRATYTELEAKQVKIGNRRYIVCRNLAEAGAMPSTARPS